jgi:hypothetical protein
MSPPDGRNARTVIGRCVWLPAPEGSRRGARSAIPIRRRGSGYVALREPHLLALEITAAVLQRRKRPRSLAGGSGFGSGSTRVASPSRRRARNSLRRRRCCLSITAGARRATIGRWRMSAARPRRALTTPRRRRAHVMWKEEHRVLAGSRSTRRTNTRLTRSYSPRRPAHSTRGSPPPVATDSRPTASTGPRSATGDSSADRVDGPVRKRAPRER